MLKLAALMMIAALLSLTMINIVSTTHYAEARKATDDTRTLRNKYSYWMGNTVCGDQLCPGNPYFKWNMKYRTYQSPYDTYFHPELLTVNKQK